MYTLRITSLLRTFHAFGQSGTLYIEPTHNYTEDPWKAYLQLQQGIVSSCYVQRQSDQHILWQDTKALKWLETQERLFWNLEDTSHAPLPLVQNVPSSANHYQLKPEATTRSTMQAMQQLKSDMQEKRVLSKEERTVHPTKNTPFSLIPQRTFMAEEALAALSRDHKRVFALIDGHRTTAQIATLLHYSPEHVVQLLHTLQKKGLAKL